MAWNLQRGEEDIALEWIRRTFTNDSWFVESVTETMLASRESTLNYMTPLGLHNMLGSDHHYGPAPWINAEEVGRHGCTSVYYH